MSEDTCKEHSGCDARIGRLERNEDEIFSRLKDTNDRLIRVEENTKQIPQMALDLQALKEQRAVSKSFLAGMIFVVSSISSLLGVIVSAWATSRGGGH